MYVTYGSQNLSALNGLAGTSTLSAYTRQYLSNQQGQPDTVRISVKASGTVCLPAGTSYTTLQAQDAIDGAVGVLQVLCSSGGQDLSLRKDDGDQSNITLPNALSLGGVSLSDLRFPNEKTVDYATGIDWEFTASALYNDPNAPDVLSYTESVEIFGGGPDYQWTVPVSGDPVRWQTAAVTVGTLVQSGTIVGRDSHFILPASLYPGYYIANQSSAGVTRPLYREDGSVYAYQRSWRYVHQKAGPFDLPELGAP